MADILSVGIDIGTSTTQVVFSRLLLENTGGYFSVPRVSIVDKQILYKSRVHLTPLTGESRIDADRVRELVAAEYRKAGFSPGDTGSGAVIITGESARKDNSDAVLKSLSDFAGDFVVSAAGPDMESVIAGKGSGAYEYSIREHCRTANLDIGGGTTNVAVFDDGRVAAKGCLDIGGRLIRIAPDMTVTKASPAAVRAAADAGVDLYTGMTASRSVLERITGRMADVLTGFLDGRKSLLADALKTPGSSDFDPGGGIDAVCFSGGVADGVYHPKEDLFRFGDIGILLGRAVAASPLMRRYSVIEAGETIHATVVGAGTYTTTVSGSTITYTRDIFPLKNIPVLKLNGEEEAACFAGDCGTVEDRIRWFMGQNDAPLIITAMDGPRNPSYTQIRAAAGCLGAAMDRCFEAGLPLILVTERDIAKAVGQTMHRMLGGRRQVVAIDGVRAEDGDYVDMGRPVMDGMVIPVVVKTLIFG